MTARCKGMLGLVLAATMLWAGGCDKVKSKEAKQQDAIGAITWQKVEITCENGNKETVEVGRYKDPIIVKPLPLDQLKRETPLDTFVSLHTIMASKDEKQMKALADHYMESQEFLTKHPDAKGYFADAAKADDRPHVVGLIKWNNYTLVVAAIRRASPDGKTHTAYRGTCMQEIDGKYYITEKAKLHDPVLRQLTADEFKVVKKPAGSNT